MLELWVEVGCSWEDFLKTPANIIGKLSEYRRAKEEGDSRKRAQIRAKDKLNKMNRKK